MEAYGTKRSWPCSCALCSWEIHAVICPPASPEGAKAKSGTKLEFLGKTQGTSACLSAAEQSQRPSAKERVLEWSSREVAERHCIREKQGLHQLTGQRHNLQCLSGRLHAAMRWANVVTNQTHFKICNLAQVDSLQDLRAQHSLASEELEKAKEYSTWVPLQRASYLARLHGMLEQRCVDMSFQ